MSTCYNTDLSLWQNFTPAYPMHLTDGQLYLRGEGWIARFANQAQGEKTLREAGFTPALKDDTEGWMRLKPARGVTFEHARVLNPDNSPMVFRVTAIRRGYVYYRPTGGGGKQCTPLADFSKTVKRLLS